MEISAAHLVLRGAWRAAAGLLVLLSVGQIVRAQPSDADPRLSSLKRLTLEELAQVEVSSVSRRPEKWVESAAAVQIITSDEIRRSGYTTLPDAFRLADNLNVAQKTPHDWAISSRGFNSNFGDKLLVLIDGRSVYTPLFSGVFWNSQDYLLEDISQVEVVSGPGGTLWGANAVNGVIDVITKPAAETQGLYVESGAGSEVPFFGGMRYGGTFGPGIFFRVYGKYLTFDDARLASGVKASDDWGQWQTGFRVDAQPVPDLTYSLHGDIYAGELGIQTGGEARLAGGNLVARGTKVFSDRTEVTLQAYFDRTHVRDPFAQSNFAPAGELVDDLDTYDVDLQVRTRAMEGHTIVAGVGYRLIQDRIAQQAPNFGFFPSRQNQDRFSAFFQDEVRIVPRVFATVGLKVEHNYYTGWETEPNARLRFQITPTQMIWAAVSRAVRMPSRFDRDVSVPTAVPPLIKGGSTFKSEELVAYELGYRAQVSDRVSGSLNFFYNDYDDLRSLRPDPVTVLPVTYANGLEGETYGLELSTDWQLTDVWRVHAGYALLKEDIRQKPGEVDFYGALDETADPEHQLSLRTSANLGKNWEADLLYRWVDRLPVNNGGTLDYVPSYGELNFRIAFRVSGNVELSIVGQNLLQRSHPEFAPPSPNREELERRLFGKIVLRF